MDLIAKIMETDPELGEQLYQLYQEIQIASIEREKEARDHRLAA